MTRQGRGHRPGQDYPSSLTATARRETPGLGRPLSPRKCVFAKQFHTTNEMTALRLPAPR